MSSHLKKDLLKGSDLVLGFRLESGLGSVEVKGLGECIMSLRVLTTLEVQTGVYVCVTHTKCMVTFDIIVFVFILKCYFCERN